MTDAEAALSLEKRAIIGYLRFTKAEFQSAIDTIIHDIIHQTVGFGLPDAQNAQAVVKQALGNVWEASA